MSCEDEGIRVVSKEYDGNGRVIATEKSILQGETPPQNGIKYLIYHNWTHPRREKRMRRYAASVQPSEEILDHIFNGKPLTNEYRPPVQSREIYGIPVVSLSTSARKSPQRI